MLQHEDALLQEYEKSLLGDPQKDRKIYEADSPITYIHAVKAPLLVLQGENDPRVPKEEAQQVVDLLKKDDKTVDVHYYSNEGHGFEKRENRIDAVRRMVAWFDKYLKGNREGFRNPLASGISDSAQVVPALAGITSSVITKRYASSRDRDRWVTEMGASTNNPPGLGIQPALLVPH